MAATLAAAAIAGGASFLSSRQAAGATRDAASMSTGELARQYDLSREDLAPWRDYGRSALQMLGRGLGIMDPGGTTGDGATGSGGIPRPLSAGPGGGDVPTYTPEERAMAWQRLLMQENPGQTGFVTADRVQEYLEERYPRSPAAAAAASGMPSPVFAEGSMGAGEFNEPLVFDPGDEFTEPLEAGDVLLQLDPGYEFRLQEGNKALDRAQAAGGVNLSGRGFKELMRYGQDYASGEYGAAFSRTMADRARRYGTLADIYNTRVADRTRRFNQLATVAGLGQTATQQTAALGATTASGIAQAYGQQGQGLANIYSNTGANVNNAVQQGLQNYHAQQAYQQNMNMQQQWLNAYRQSTQAPAYTGSLDFWPG